MEPKIRLNGFEGEWVKAPFSEIANRTSASASSLNYPGVEFEDINSGEGTLNKDVSRKKIVKIGKLFSEGDVLFGKLRPYLKNILLADFKGVAIGDFWVLRPQKVTSELLYILVNSREFMRIANISSGSKMPRADWNLVSSTSFAYPETKNEQNAIGAYFLHIESLIQSTTKKIESLKQVKAASLQSMFPQEGETTPRVRFKGFEGEWECVRFSDVAQIYRGLTYSPSNISDKGVRVLRSSNIDEDTFVITESDVFVEEECVHINYAKKGDIIITAANGSPRLVGKHAIITEDGNGTLVAGGFMLLATSNEANFLNASMSSSWYNKFLKVGVAGGNGSIGNLNKTDLEQCFLPYPKKKEERDAIASYFTNLDSQINLQTQRLEKLKQIKSACLDNMFV